MRLSTRGFATSNAGTRVLPAAGAAGRGTGGAPALAGA